MAWHRGTQGPGYDGDSEAGDFDARRGPESRLRAVLESLHDGVVVQDADGVIVESNEAAHRILGLSADEISGRTSLDPMWRAIREDGSPYPGDEHPAMVTLATGEPVRGALMGVHKRDGSLTWIVINTALLPASDGRQVVASFTDVTELRVLEQRYQLLAENASDFVYRLDVNGVIEWVSANVTALLGWSPQDWVGHDRAEFTHTDDIPVDPHAKVAGRSGGRVRLRTKAGGYRWMEMSDTQVRDPIGQSVAVVGSARDATEAVRCEASLEQSSAQLQLVLENIADVVGRLSADGILLWVSPSIRTAFGWDPDDIVGTPFRISAPQSREYMQELMARAIRDHADYYEARLQVSCAHGELRWADAHNTLVWNGAGELDSMIVTMRDVTDEVAAQQALADRERILQRMLEAATDVVFELAPDHTYRWVSPSVTKVLGWEPDQLVGLSGADMIHPDDFPKIRAVRDRPEVASAWAEPFRYRQADGKYRWMSGSSREVRDGDATLIGRVVGLRDVDDLVRTRQTLEVVGQRYRLLAENSTDVVFELNADAEVVWVSPSVEQVLGWSREQVIGAKGVDLVHPDDLVRLRQWRGEAASGAASPAHPAELRCRTAEGGFRWMSIQVRLLMGDDGVRSGAVVGVRDVQEQVLARREAEASRRRFSTMFATHEAMMLLIDPRNGAIVDANRSAERFYGYSRDQLTHMLISDINMLPASEVAALWREALERRRNAFVFPHRLADGTVRQVEVHSSPIEEPDRTLLFSIVRDVTDELAAREALVAAETRLRLLAENATDAVYLVSPTGTIEWISPAVNRVLGWTPDALVGSEAAQLVHPDDIPTYRRSIAVVEEAHTAVHWEFRVKRADGDYRWMSAVTSPFRDESGALVGRLSALRDIEQEVRDRQALARSEQTLRLAMAGAPHAMAIVGLDGAIQQANQVLRDLVGRDDSWLAEHTEMDLLDPAEVEAERVAKERLLGGDREYSIRETRLITAAGAQIWVQHSLALVRDEGGAPMFYVSQFEDITKARAVRTELQRRATHDPLTGLINRDELGRRVEQVLGPDARPAGGLALLYCDLDHFKGVNDSYGHAVGDAVLQSTAQRIRSVLRTMDEVARLGGDEFVVLLADVLETTTALEVAQRIRSAVAEPMTIDDQTLSVTLSIGVALAVPGAQAHQLLRDADQALYRAKDGGRDRVIAAAVRAGVPDGEA